ncbi:hypothetical protein T439DRAFT_323388 [Meredithblackwellia eburnea MCA 4105]
MEPPPLPPRPTPASSAPGTPQTNNHSPLRQEASADSPEEFAWSKEDTPPPLPRRPAPQITLQEPSSPVPPASPSHTPPRTAPGTPPQHNLPLEPPAPPSPAPSSSPSYFPSEDDDDEVLECIAEQIATKTEPEDPWATGVGSYASQLGRRLTLRRVGTGVSAVTAGERDGDNGKSIRSFESRREVQGMSKEMREALDRLEDEEVAGFLSRVGKQVQEVRVAVPKNDIPYPDKGAFVATNGKTDWFGYGKAYITTVAIIHTPPSLLVPPRPTRLHISTTRSYLERLYVIFPPSTWESILHVQLGSIWRWESEHTWKWCALYSFLWLFNLLPLLPFGILLFLILRSRLFPPTPEEILSRASDRIKRSAEAAELSQELKKTSKIGFALQGARGLFHRKAESKENVSALAMGLQGSMMLGGMVAAGTSAVNNEKGGMSSLLSGIKKPKEDKDKTTSALARAIAGTSGVAGGIAAPTRVTIEELQAAKKGKKASKKDESEDDDSDEEDKESRHAKGTSLYGTMQEVLRVFGPPIQEYLGQASDMAEKIKNLMIHSDHPSVEPVCLRLIGICAFILLCPSWLLYKGITAYFGLEFFVLWKFREQHPEWRRALMPWWWVFIGAPTDAEYATFILQKRSRQHKPLRGAKTIKRMARNRARRGSIDSVDSGSASFIDKAPVKVEAASSALGSSALAFGLGIGALRARSPSFVEPLGEIIGTYFALLQATPGSLVIRTNRVCFQATKGFRTLGLKLNKKTIGDDDASFSFGGGGDDLMSVRPEDITGLKKDKKLGFEGMTITEKDGSVWKLSNVSRRDDAFNKIVSISPTAWQNT